MKTATQIHHDPEAYAALFNQPTLSATKAVFRALTAIISLRCRLVAMEINADAIERRSVRFDDTERKIRGIHAPRTKTVLKVFRDLANGPLTVKDIGVSKPTAQQIVRLMPWIQDRVKSLRYRPKAPLAFDGELPY